MRIYKTRADFTALQNAGSPGVFAGTVCTITDEASNPMYVYQGGVWNSTVTSTTNPLTGRIELSSGKTGLGVGRESPPTLHLLGDSLTALNFTFSTVTAVSISGTTMTITTSAEANGYAGGQFRIVNLTDSAGVRVDGNYEFASRASATSYTATIPAGFASGACGLATCRLYNLQILSDNGPVNWMNILSGQKFDITNITAGHGWKLAEMYANVSKVIASGEDYCAFLGGTNDYSLITDQTTYDNHMPGIKQALSDIIKALANAGITVQVFTTPPMASPAYNAYSAAAIIEGNKSIWALSRRFPKVIIVDAYGAIVDPMGATKGSAKTGMLQSDGLHWTQAGAYAIGKVGKLAVAHIPLVDTRITSNADNYTFSTNSTNILDSAPWAATGGTVSAPVTNTAAAADWSYFRSGTITVAEATAPARSDGFGYDAKLSGTPTAASDRLNLTTTTGAPNARLVAGQNYVADLSVAAAGLSGSNASKVQHRIDGTIDGTAVVVASGLYGSNTTQAVEDWNGVIRTPKFKFNGAVTGNLVQTWVAWFSAAGTSMNISAGRAAFNKIF